MRLLLIITVVGISAFAGAGCSGPFTATGTVVDQYGNPIDGVSLHLTGAAANRYEFDAYAGESSFELKDGRFRVTCRFCTALHLFFSKEGYYSQSLDLAVFEWKSGLEIVMRRVEFPVKLRKYSGRMESGPAIDDRVLGFGASRPHDQRLSELMAANVIPARPYVTLMPVIDADGSFGTQTSEGGRATPRVALDFSGARGGVVPFQPSTMNLREGLKEMYVAPDGEYPASLELDPASSHSFFYCKIAGQYCKGIVHVPRLERRDGEPAVITNIEIHVSPYYGNRSLDDPTTY